MTVVNLKDIDAQMKAYIDPNSVPKHNGGDQGVMEGRFLAQSEHVEVQQGHGRRGATEVVGDEIPQHGYYGSSTVVSLSDLEGTEQLPAGMEPKRPGAPTTAATPAPVVQPTVTRQRTAQEMAAMMLGKKLP